MKVLRPFLLSVFLFLPSLLLAQTGSIAGVVTDSTGALVGSAQVTATHVGTGAVRTLQSSESGAYSIPNLPVGKYVVSFEKSGFKPIKVDGVEVSVAQTVPLNAQFQLGSVQETVTVTTESQAPVETESSQLSNLVDSRRIADLPLLTRNPYDLLLLSPGTSTTTALGGYTVNGSRERNNNFLLDGADNNDTSVPGGAGSIVLNSNPESTQEFRVITNAFNAEYGRNTGAIVDVVTKSGTNQFHFDAYWFGRYNGFGGARDWFNRAEDPVLPQMNPYVRNQFGYSIGGPIIKNKTFFFFNNEFQRFRTTLTLPATVPTAQFKNTGQFDWHTSTIDPVSGHVTPVTIPVDLTASSPQGIGVGLDPTIQQIFTFFPDPTRLNPDGFTGQVFFPSSSRQDSYQTVLKVDHRFTDRHVLSMRYGYNHAVDPNSGHTDILPGNIAAVGQKSISGAAAASLSSTLTNHLVNVFNVGWNHIYSNFNCQRLDALNSVSPLDQFGYGRDYLMAPFSSFGCTALVADGQFRKTGTTSFGDDLSWARGNHTFKFGADFRNVGESGPNSFFSRRSVDTRSSTTFGVNFLTIDSPTPGEELDPADFGNLADAASAYWGVVVSDFNGQFFDPQGVRKPVDDKNFRQHEYDFFVQDSWKVRRNLTLNLGMRYQFNGVPFEEHANFSNLLTDPTSFPVVFSRVGPGTGKEVYANDYSNIEPRVGFSWDPWGDGKTAVRGAFGIFHDRVFGNLFGNARGNPPFEQDYQAFPFETINDAFGSGLFPAIAPTQVPSPSIPEGAGLAPIILDNHFRNSSSTNWNFGIQREIGGNFVIDVNYVASKGTHIYREVDGNPPDPALVQQLLDFCVPTNPDNTFGCTDATVAKANLWFGFENGVLPFNAVAHNAMFQPFYNRSIGNSNYNALQAKVTRRFSRGFQVQGSYTYSHAIDDSGDPLNPAAGNRGFPRNTRKIFQERGNSDNDLRHIGVINYIWEVPLGAGKAHWNQGVMGKVFEGIQVSGITSFQTGHPFDIFSTRDSEHTGLSNRADVTGDPYHIATPFLASGNRGYLNPDSFDTPPFGRAGDVGRNNIYGPGYVNFDMAVAKKLKLTERLGLETRFEAFNLFNHPQFTNPGADANANGNLLGSGIFGEITSTLTHSDGTTSARQMQVAMKLTF